MAESNQHGVPTYATIGIHAGSYRLVLGYADAYESQFLILDTPYRPDADAIPGQAVSEAKRKLQAIGVGIGMDLEPDHDDEGRPTATFLLNGRRVS